MRYIELVVDTPAVLYSCLAALAVVGLLAVLIIVRLGRRGEGARLAELADSEVGPAAASSPVADVTTAEEVAQKGAADGDERADVVVVATTEDLLAEADEDDDRPHGAGEPAGLETEPVVEVADLSPTVVDEGVRETPEARLEETDAQPSLEAAEPVAAQPDDRWVFRL